MILLYMYHGRKWQINIIAIINIINVIITVILIVNTVLLPTSPPNYDGIPYLMLHVVVLPGQLLPGLLDSHKAGHHHRACHLQEGGGVIPLQYFVFCLVQCSSWLYLQVRAGIHNIIGFLCVSYFTVHNTNMNDPVDAMVRERSFWQSCYIEIHEKRSSLPLPWSSS